MQAGQRFHLWTQWRKFKRTLKRRKGIDLSSGDWFIVSDYGWEDCGYEGPMTLEEAVKQYYLRYNWDNKLTNWKEYAMIHIHGLFDHTTTHYITNESWRIERINERQEGW